MSKTIRTIALITALAAILPAVACAPSRTAESTGQYVDNSAVTAKVKAAILEDPDLKVMQIHVNTFKDTVQLSGFVDTPQMAARAASVARQVEGVKAVQNDLIVK